MKTRQKILLSTLASLAVAPALLSAAPLLGSDMNSFAILAGQYISTGADTSVTGNVGAVSYITTGANSFGYGTNFSGSYIATGLNFVSTGSNYAMGYITTGAGSSSTGSNYAGSYISVGAGSSSTGNYAYSAVPNLSAVNRALSQLTAAQSSLNSMEAGTTLGATMGGLHTLNAGVYSASALTTAASTRLTLDGQGLSNQDWIFNIHDYLSTGAGTVIDIINAGSGSTVTWNTGGYASFGAGNSVIGTVLAGTYISTGAGTTTGHLLAHEYVTLGANGNASCLSCVVAAVPEPESYAMLLAGLGLIGAISRRRQKMTSSRQRFLVQLSA